MVTILLLVAALQDCDGLVRRLGDDDLAEREKAAAELRSAGARAMPALRKAAASPDVEIAGRAKAVIAAIERDDRVRRAIPAPARITLKTRDRTYREVIDDIARLAGHELSTAGVKAMLDQRSPAADLKDASLGEALSAVGLAYALNEKGGAWLMDLDRVSPHRQFRGPLEMRASLGKKLASLDFIIEPGHAAACAVVLEVLAARDEKDQVMPFGPGRTVLPSQTAFGWVCDPPERLTSLRVRATVLYAVEKRTVSLTPKGEEATHESVGFRFTHRSRAGTPPEVVLQIRPVVPGPDAELRMDALRSARPVLRGPGKSVLSARVSGPTTMTEESATGVDTYRYFTLEREKESDPWDVRGLEIDMPIDVEARAYEFEFKDLVRRDD